jgi:hypothetical protein
MKANRAKKPHHSLHEAYLQALSMVGSRPDVTGVDIGPKYVSGERTRKKAVRIHVGQKLSSRQLTESERIPKQVLGIATDIVVGRYRRHGIAPNPSARFDPIQPGISVGNPKAEAGTLGLVVYDDETGVPCLLGSFHVLAGPDAVEGDPITQPARFDQGSTSKDTIATLFRFFTPGPWGDAALARFNDTRHVVPEIFGTGVQIDQLDMPEPGMVVEKCGRTTGVARGRIEGLGTYFYPGVEMGVTGFRIVPLIDTPDPDIAAPGDSGSVYYVPGTTTGIGLHCAGGIDPLLGEVGIACSLSQVLLTLRASLFPP